MILAIDFDGTIHDHKNPVAGRTMGPPILGAKETLINFKNDGHTIVVHSVWGNDRNGAIKAWLKYFEIPYDEVTNIKPDADYYIDDKAIKFTNWNDIWKQL